MPASESSNSTVDQYTKYYYLPYHPKHIKPVPRDPGSFLYDFGMGEGVQCYVANTSNKQQKFMFEYGLHGKLGTQKAYNQVLQAMGKDSAESNFVKGLRGYEERSYEERIAWSPPPSPTTTSPSKVPTQLPHFSVENQNLRGLSPGRCLGHGATRWS